MDEGKPAVRVIKASAGRAKAGVIRVEDAGKTYYRGACDRCSAMVTTSKMPLHDQELVCNACRWVISKGKPSTRVRRKGTLTTYFTECDVCGDVQKTPFMPKKERDFLCDLCFRAERQDQARARALASAVEVDEAPVPDAPTTEPILSEVDPTPVASEEPLHDVACRQCGKRVAVRFSPARGESFVCKDCFLASSARKEKELNKEKPETRLWFQIECVRCGKLERVNFVPKSLTESICTDCYPKKPRRT
jgi:CxxC-x17-CxxC domain-containing protein